MTCKGAGDKNFCKYSKLFPGWWNRESDCFKSLCWIAFLWGENSHSNLARKELHFYCFLKLCPVAATHATMSWADVLLGTFWPGENKWWAVKPSESWSFISGVQISYHFLLLPFYPLHPNKLEEYFFFPSCPCLEQFSYARPQALLSASTTMADLP